MAKFPTDRIRQRRIESLPDWVVDQMILLSEFAGDSGLPAFESALIEAMENVMGELNKSKAAPRATPAPVGHALNNVVFWKVNPVPRRSASTEKLHMSNVTATESVE